MKLLILGGTVFLGRAIVEQALARGHEVTLFTRGQRNPDLFPEAEKLRGNRDGDLAPLDGRHWDAAIDTSGYVPRVVRAGAQHLADAVGHYSFVSTLSVYAEFKQRGQDESGPIGKLADESVEEVTGETYGPLKALCEQAVQDTLPGRALIVRPGLIVGPHDPTDRFTYWPRRVAQGGEVLAPGDPSGPVQFIDVRDLGGWILRMAEAGGTGTFNATGPADPLPFATFLGTCKAVSGSDARFTWIPGRFLLDAGLQPWMEVPLWIGEDDEAFAGFDAVSSARAIAAGLTFRSLAETIRDTLAWDATRPADTEHRAGLKHEREQEVLTAWHGQAG
jgi:2'-hydroxyisoflavone reductase